MTAATQASDGGLYPEYTFNGVRKNAAFKRCAGPERGGMGWVVGVGINNDDIYRGAHELRTRLIQATSLVVLVAVLLTMVIARRTTAPILTLQEHTRRVASGDLEARVDVKSNDELGELATAFNQMTGELKDSRDKLVKAEKDAAWREMARQIAHDIKNPLTPIQLSVDLLRRARREGAADFDAIFARTTDTISRQVAHLREIASDFHALTGSTHARPEPLDVGKLVDEVLELNSAWAREIGVDVARSGNGGIVRADPGLLRRALINVVSNALQAMPEGGHLRASVAKRDSRVVIELADTGSGISDEARTHLFEPYFTTRTTGTGLGLAIARRVVEEMGGTIALDNNDPPPGSTARIELPLHRG
jgi:nitrogen fixation/metabolism regulation signal transduction histidine kinase